MELDEFIKKSLVSICKGILDTKKATLEKFGADIVAPPNIIIQNQDGTSIDLLKGDKEEKIEFDISVTVSENNEKNKNCEGGIGGGIKVVSANISGNKSERTEIKNESISRIKFSVPFYPAALNAKDSKNK